MGASRQEGLRAPGLWSSHIVSADCTKGWQPVCSDILGPNARLHITQQFTESGNGSKICTLRLAVYRQSLHLDVKPLETHDQRFFQLNSCGNTLYVTPSLLQTSSCL
jgi:hypothetical protein